jgi:hypothetical protein
MRKVFVAVTAAAVVLAGCTAPAAAPPAGDPSAAGAGEPPNSTPTGPPPSVGFTASVSRAGEAVRISYRLVNEDGIDLYVLNRVLAQQDPDWYATEPDDVYITGRSGATVEIAKRAFDIPPGTYWEVPYEIGATRLEPGGVVAEEFAVPLPLDRRHPYTIADAPIRLPDRIESVVFCIGVTDRRPHTSRDSREPFLFEQISTSWQHLLCSEPTLLE